MAKDLFEPASARRLHAAHRHKYLYLLTLATAGSGAAFATTRATLDTAQRSCVRGPLAAHERAEARAALRAAVAMPVGALCLLVWLEPQWADRAFFTSSYDAELYDELLALLVELAERHPLQSARVLRVLAAPIRLLPGADLDALVALELKRHALDALWALVVRTRCALPALAALRAWQALGVLDHSLVRRFVERLLAALAPPYSAAFAAAVVALCADDSTLAALRATATLQLVVRFLDACSPTTSNDDALANAVAALRSRIASSLKK